jgi:acetaldehyde dehydrogenase/alcohol dehydrogenase
MGSFSQYGHPKAIERYGEIADALGLKGKAGKDKVDALINAIEDLKEKLGVHKTIRAYGIEEQAFLDSLDEMTEQAFDDQCTGANPRYPLMAEMKQLYLNAYYGEATK